MYFNTKGGGKRLTQKAEQYIRKSRAIINESIDEQNWVKQNNSTWYYADLIFFMPDRRVRDSHNMLKLLLDVMQGIVYHNDYYIMPRIQAVEYDINNPRVDVLITPQSITTRKKGLSLAL